MQARLVIFGHAAHFKEDGECIVPEGTSITFYSPLGGFLDERVCNALANGEIITSKDIKPIKDDIYFFNRSITPPPAQPSHLLELKSYPKTFKSGEIVPNYMVVNGNRKTIEAQALNPTDTQVLDIKQQITLSQLLEENRGRDLHWAACSYAKQPDENSIAHGYAYKIVNPNLQKIYCKGMSEEEKRARRAERFKKEEPITLARAGAMSPRAVPRTSDAQEIETPTPSSSSKTNSTSRESSRKTARNSRHSRAYHPYRR